MYENFTSIIGEEYLKRSFNFASWNMLKGQRCNMKNYLTFLLVSTHPKNLGQFALIFPPIQMFTVQTNKKRIIEITMTTIQDLQLQTSDPQSHGKPIRREPDGRCMLIAC